MVWLRLAPKQQQTPRMGQRVNERWAEGAEGQKSLKGTRVEKAIFNGV